MYHIKTYCIAFSSIKPARHIADYEISLETTIGDEIVVNGYIAKCPGFICATDENGKK